MKTKKVALIIVCLILLIVLAGAAILFFHAKNNYLVLKGAPVVSVGLHGIYKEQGAKAVFEGENVSDRVEITGEVDTEKPGTYTISYTYEDLIAERTVTVEKEMNPVLELGSDSLVLKLGESYVPCSITATDKKGRDISSSVKVSSTEFKRAGDYNIKFSVTDDQGNTTVVYRQVHVKPNLDYQAAGLAICMYHYIYDEQNPPDDVNRRYGNYIGLAALKEEIDYLKKEQYYFPSWQEVRDYLDGKLLLPDKSIVLTFDDGAKDTLIKGIDLLDQFQVPITSFIITSKGGKQKIQKYRSQYITYQSHSHNMHRGGGRIGHGGIMTVLPEKEILTDLKTSIKICGSSDAFAYPFGDYTQESRDAVKKAGFLCAVTTDWGKVYPGDDPYSLKRLRMVQGQSLQGFINKLN